MTTRIEDYAIIGDTESAALVSLRGSIDWLCLPRFDSPSCFAALLGGPEHGRWVLRPVGKAHTTRTYRGDTYVLETTHETETGTVRVTDVMPLRDGRADILRSIEGLAGQVEMTHEWVVRFGYGRIRPWVSRIGEPGTDSEALLAVAGPDLVVLRGTRLPRADRSGDAPFSGAHRDRFAVAEGEVVTFGMTWLPSHHKPPEHRDVGSRVEETARLSGEWAAKCTYQGPYRAAVVRSLLTLKLLTDTRWGGIVAAATTSLPEDFGGVRNWDYRYCWLRDASLTLGSLLRSGYVESAELWREWLVRAVAGDPEDQQIMYAVDGGRDLPERELDWLPGYEHSRPVRVGNAAVDQRQTDVLGEVMVALEYARKHGLKESTRSWAVQRALVEALADHWDEPDQGIWEIRGPARDFTHSRVQVWAALDRGIRAVEEHGLRGPVGAWRAAREKVRAQVLERGFDESRNTFVQYYSATEVDASLLLIPVVGFLPPDDPRVLGTIAAIESDLMSDGLVLRYRTESGVDGLTGDEGHFLACSFWLVIAYAGAGRLADAKALMDRLVGLSNDVGLLAEEYDVKHRRMAGNFPQALSHLALINAAYAIAEAESAGGSEDAGTVGG